MYGSIHTENGRMRYNRAKSETTMNGCCFADFVQISEHIRHICWLRHFDTP